jgi:hypothetical protein
MTIRRLESRDLNLWFELHSCSGWQSREDLMAGIRLVLDHAPLLPLEPRLIPVGEKKYAYPVARDLPAWFEAGYRVQDKWDPITLRWPDFQEQFVGQFRLLLEDEWRTDQPLSGEVELGLHANRFGDIYNCLEFLCTLFGTSIAFPDRPSWIPYANAVARIYLDCARPLIELLRPEYAIISNADHYNTYGRDVLASRLQIVHWGNYWGPSYLDRYGENLWSTPPGWRTEEWAGGIWYQVTEDFRSFGLAEREAINEHYAGQHVEASALIEYLDEQ